jgi:TonB family protein
VAVELPAFVGGTQLSPTPADDALAAPPTTLGGAAVARLDTRSIGEGGDLTVDRPAVHLSDADDRMRLSPDLLSRLDRDQVQRIRSSRERASWEDRRATTHPSELTFVLSGAGDLLERRPESRVSPSRGARIARSPSTLGGEFVGSSSSAPELEPGAEAAASGPRVGGPTSSPGRGVRAGSPGMDHRASADVGRARPDVEMAAVAVQAAEKGRVKDDIDAEQEVATTLRALVHASTAGGVAGTGRGGTRGGGDPGAGGAEGVGSHPAPRGDGMGDSFDIDTSDPRLVPYFRRVQARIEPLWAHAFPRSAMLDLKQGTVILEFRVSRDGGVKVYWPPLRPSGVEEFDRNCADAIRRAGPFDPIPPELGRDALHIRAPFVASSAIVP